MRLEDAAKHTVDMPRRERWARLTEDVMFARQAVLEAARRVCRTGVTTADAVLLRACVKVLDEAEAALKIWSGGSRG